jgi:uncharacterized iron-regulated membrane protein
VARTLILAHRYLGIALGLLMVLWCLSGMVMLYVPYPQLTETERVQHLQPIDWSRCCVIGDTTGSVSSFQAEMLDRRPLLRITTAARNAAAPSARTPGVVDLATGLPVIAIPQGEAAQVAATHSARPAVPPRLIALAAYDQWTVQGRRGPDRPLFHFSLDDEPQTEVYVSTVTGKAVQKTTAVQRFWNWLGAIPHWLYFTPLRTNGELWSQVVIWTSLVGSFLTITGLYVGIKQLKRRSSGRWIAYKGFQYWHHVVGLGFGLFVLTWVVSGLISMNPWGFLEGEGFDEPGHLQGAPLSMSEVTAALNALAHSSLGADVVQVQSAPLAGKLFMVITRADTARIRLDERANPTLLSADELKSIADTLAEVAQERDQGPATGQGPRFLLDRLEREDEYYFSHHREQARLPAYRVTVSARNGGLTRYYIDPVSGEILRKVDPDNQWYRWLHQAPHRFDFSAMTRSRPLWDVLTLTLLSGTTVVCAIGAYLGLRRLVGR